MREKLLAIIEKNSKIDMRELAVIMGIPEIEVANELKALEEEGACEMKRLYVQAAYRKFGIGEALVIAILADAKQLGYTKMKLDTLERLKAAITLYLKHGFSITTAYYHNPLPEVVYMEKLLKP